MKKRTLSVLLCLALLLALSATAFAEPATITYTLKSGDTVAKVCQDLGIDFVKNYNWITTTNNITSYNSLPVGTVLTLPAPGTYPTLETAAPAAAADAAAATVVVAGAPAAVVTGTGDPVSFYLISHTLQSGETVYSICNAYGIKFDANANTISKLNNITSYTNLKVGQVLLLPSATVPSFGNYYKVLAHTVVSGDTVGALCTANGINYGKSQELMKVLNNKTDLTVIKVGETFYLPVFVSGTAAGGTATTVPAGTTAAAGTTAGTTTTTTTTATAATTTTPTISYTMKSGDTVAKVCQTLGIDFYKNYAWITAANKIQDYSKIYVGQVLTLPAPGTVATGTAAGTGTATAAGSTVVSGSGSYSLHTSSNGTYLMQVGGQTVNSANQGQTVTIVPIPDKGYALESITVTKTGANDQVPVTNNSFVMPGYAVSIVVTFKPAS